MVVLTAGDAAMPSLLEACKSLGGHMLSSFYTVSPTEDERSTLPLFFGGGNYLHRALNHTRSATFVRAIYGDVLSVVEGLSSLRDSVWSLDFVRGDFPRVPAGPLCMLSVTFSADLSDSIASKKEFLRGLSPIGEVFDPNIVGVDPSFVLDKVLFKQLQSQYNPHRLMNPGKMHRLFPCAGTG